MSAEPVVPGEPARYLIWSHEHHAWWRPDRCGYTEHVSEAGRYSFEEAGAIVVPNHPAGIEVAVPEIVAQRHGNASVFGIGARPTLPAPESGDGVCHLPAEHAPPDPNGPIRWCKHEECKAERGTGAMGGSDYCVDHDPSLRAWKAIEWAISLLKIHAGVKANPNSQWWLAELKAAQGIVDAAARLAKIYFDIGATAYGETEVRRLRDEILGGSRPALAGSPEPIITDEIRARLDLRLGYVLAMAVMQSSAWASADEELRDAAELFTTRYQAAERAGRAAYAVDFGGSRPALAGSPEPVEERKEVHNAIDANLDEIIWKAALPGDRSDKIAACRKAIHDAVRVYRDALLAAEANQERKP